MELYLIRHGESESNAADTHAGWAPVNLTELGRQQAARTAKMLEGVDFDLIYVSDLKRAQQTARILFGDKPFEYCTMIREMNNTAMRGKGREEMTELFPELYPECRRRFDYAPLGWDCESGAHLLARAGEFLEFMSHKEFKRAAVVCHAGFIRACAASALGMTTHNPPLTCRNASVSVLTYRNGSWRLKLWDATDEWP